jgi:hypothetical protein
MAILSKEEEPLCDLAQMVPNSYFVGPHGEEPEEVLNFVEVRRGPRSPGKRYLLNISMCALVLKWRYTNKKGSGTDADKAYESTCVSSSIHTLFAWLNDNDIEYKNIEFNRSGYCCTIV